MQKNVMILAAPFGYGPASKALLIADALANVARITLFSDRDAFHMLERYRGGTMACRAGIFQKVYPAPSDLAPFDAFVSVNNEPAVHHLIRSKLADRTIFVDSLLPWRSANAAPQLGAEILAYVVQDFPGAAAGLAGCRAKAVELTAPMVWSKSRSAHAGEQSHLLLHLGGVTSPLVPWQALRKTIDAIVAQVAQFAQRHGRPLVVIGSRHLEEFRTRYTGAVKVVPEASPEETAALIQESRVLLTTPGIGALYEALVCAVPVVLLPPMNSTQLYSFGVFSRHGFADSMTGEARQAVCSGEIARSWGAQSAHAVQWLEGNLPAALGGLAAQLERMLDADGTGKDEQLRRQAELLASLSRKDAAGVIRDLVSRLFAGRR